MRKRLMFLLLFVPIILMAQQKNVTGKVIDNTGFQLPGVSIVVQGTTNGTVTDGNGVYTINNVPEDAKLVFSFIGFENQVIPVAGQSVIDITMNDASIGLNEVVAIGYGTIKKSDLTGSVAKIDASKISERPINRVDQALTGQMAGVSARTVSGEPGKALEIRVRGGASISASNEPLYVVDGMPVENLNDINPNDIESMEVLKDAASSAIYGSRGANGVVLISTKKGKSGQAKFQFSAYYGLQQAEKKLDLLSASEWIDMASEVIDSKWVAKTAGNSASDSYEKRAAQLGITNVTDYDMANVNYMKDPRWGTDQLAYIDWQDEFYRTAPVQDYQLSATGGNDNVTYMVSGAWYQQEGIAIETGFQRANLRANLEAKLSSRVKMGFAIAPSISWKNGMGIEGKDGVSHKLLAMTPVAEKDAGVYTNFNYNRKYLWASSSQSQIGVMESVTDETERFKLLSNLYFNINLAKGLDAKISGAWTNENYAQKNYTPTMDLINNEPGSTSSAYKDTRRSNTYLFEGLLTYSKTFGQHDFSLMGGYSTETYKYDRQYNKAYGFPNDLLQTFTLNGTATVKDSYISETERNLISYFGRLNYSFDGKYLLSGSIRRDGSSKFGWDNLWGTFPSFSAGWRVSEEQFLSSLEWISNLKVRYSWGVNGNNSISDYTTFGKVASVVYPFNGEATSGSYPSSLTNTELGWEKTASSNFGIDLGVVNNRINLAVDYYYKKTTDLLLNEPLPQTTGFSTSLQNVGSVLNSGLEFELTTHNFTGDFTWTTNANISFNENEVDKLGAEGTPILSGWSNSTNIIKEGESLNSFYLYDAIGILSAADINDASVAKTKGAIAGDIRYKDFDGDGDIDEDDVHIVGKPNPDFVWGLTNNFGYKNFDLSVLFQGQQGGESYALLGRAIDRPGMGVVSNAMGRWRDRYVSEEQPGDGHTPRIDGTTGTRLDTRWLYDASYVRLKNITLAYNFPESMLKGISRARLYVSLENMWKSDNYYGGFSPESANTNGTDYGAYPAAKSYVVGVNINF